MFNLFSTVLDKLMGPKDNYKEILAAHRVAARAEADAAIAVWNAERAAYNPAPKRVIRPVYSETYSHVDSYSSSCDSSASDSGSCDSGACGE